jgi:3-phosphoshikimate 1-carboxyvinyltransferase
MLGALADGVTEIDGFLPGTDTLATLSAFEQMGVRVERSGSDRLTIHGVGMRGLAAPEAKIDLGNSGTAMRLMTGILAAQNFASTLTGDASLNRRPMGRVLDPLVLMGASIRASNDQSGAGLPPLEIQPVSGLRGIDYQMPMASAQVKSCLLLAGLYAQGTTRVVEPAPTRDHTERMLQGFGYPAVRQGAEVSVQGGGCLSGCNIKVPADISSATFPLVAALITPGSEVLLEGVGVNPTRDGIIHLLRQMGGQIELLNRRQEGGEPVADLRVLGSALQGIRAGGAQVAVAIDEIPALAVAAACAQGVTEIVDAEELRVKESDRIATTVAGLQALGINAQERPDGMVIQGGKFRAGQVDAAGDHRLAMAFAVASLRADGPVEILDCENVVTSFPDFVALMCRLGLEIGYH